MRKSATNLSSLAPEEKVHQEPEPDQNCNNSDWPREERRQVNTITPSA
jgi:hypothetical protein